MEIVGIIPARAGSKSIKKKNLVPLAGKPLVLYTIEAAKKSHLLSRVIVSTDDLEVANLARSRGISVIMQPPELSHDTARMVNVLKNAVHILKEKAHVNPDIIVLLQPTSPLRTPQTIDACIQKLLETKAESITTVTELPHGCYYTTDLRQGKATFNLPKNKQPLRQKLKKKYYLDGCVFCITAPALLKQDRFCFSNAKNVGLVIAPQESVDIDTMLDVNIAEVILHERMKKR